MVILDDQHGIGKLRRGFLKKPGIVRVVIGPAIDPRGKKPEEIIRQAEEWIENKMLELEGA